MDDAILPRLFAPLAEAQGIGLAVSGGPDSLALALLARRWNALDGGGRRLVVLTVDHGLRPQSAAEARGVAAFAASIGLEARVLRREGPPPQADIEAAARAARYRLLFDAARAEGLSHVATAHHGDDQAETLLLRLARGSGVYGLAAMPRTAERDGIRLVRPLLDLPRAALVAIVAEAGLAAVDDPHNRDRRFARARMRALLPALAAEGLTAERLAATAGRMRRAASAIDHYAGRVLETGAAVDRFGAVELELARWRAEPEEVRLRVLARILRAAGGGEHVPRLDALSGLEAALRENGDMARTLAGAIVAPRGTRIRFEREFGRAGLPVLPVDRAGDLVWDRRFDIVVEGPVPAGAVIAALGPAGRAAVAGSVQGEPVRAVEATPALWQGERLLASPLAQAGGLIAVKARESVARRLAEAVEGEDS